MLDLAAIPIPGLNWTDSTFTLPVWAAGVVLALLVLFLLLALMRSGFVGTLAFLALIGLGGSTIYAYSERERIEERRALEHRLAELRKHALAPGSSLACLDGGSGEAVENGCERNLFAGPDSLAAAATYSAARLALLSDGMKFASRRDPAFDSTFDHMRRALEQDRFGVVANVLMVNNGCTVERCEAFALLRDATRVKANIRAKTFDTLVARHAPNWHAAPRSGAAMTDGAPSTNAAASSGAAGAATAATAEPAPPPAPVAVEPAPPSSPALAAAPTPPRRPAPPRSAQPRSTQAQPSPARAP